MWLTQVQPKLDDILLNDFNASIKSAMAKTGVSEEQIRFLIKCVMIGKPSVQLPLEVYLETGNYNGGPEHWKHEVDHWLEFPKAKEILNLFNAFG